MYKKFAVVFGVIAIAIIAVGVAIAFDWLGDSEIPEATGADNAMRITWGYTTGDLPSDLDRRQITDTEDQAEYDEAETYPEYPAEYDDEEIPHEDLAPDFTMYNAEGNQVNLSDFFGKPIVLNFWTTWCPACIVELPYFEQFRAEVGDNVQILKVNIREAREQVESFMQDSGFDFPVFFDEGAGADMFDVQFIPMTFFIDSNGQLVSSISGAATLDSLHQELERLS